MEAASTELIPDPNMSQENDDSAAAAAAAAGDCSIAEVKAETLGPGTNDESSSSQVHDHGTIQIGEINVQLVSQPDELMDEVPHDVVKEDSVVPGKEHSSDSGSKSKFIYRLNQGSKSVGRQRGRKPRGAGSMKMPGLGSSPSQPMKPYEADQTSEENENRSSSKKHSKKKTPVNTVVYDDNDPSTTRRQSQRGGEELLMGTPAHRLVLAPLPPSELNKRMATTPNQTPEKYTPTKSVATSTNLAPIQVAPTTSVQGTSPILSLQQSESTTVQVQTIGDKSDTESEYAEEAPSVQVEHGSDEEDTIESALGKLSMEIYGPDDSSEHHDSDKENVPDHEVFIPGSGYSAVKLSQWFNARQPLQTLFSAASPSVYRSPDSFTTPSASQQLYRARYQVEGGRQWQMVVDTNCLLNAESLESLKRLKGIHETRLVIPNIVIRELDYLRKQEESKARSISALQWIEVCMLEMSSWIHVQSSAETVHVAMTPPVSPSIYSRGFQPHAGESDLLQPTLHDHVLECALFQQTMPIGRVAILTDDTTLKIKALAEGLEVDTATSFSDSLLNPYSERFVYSGSTPVGRSSGRLEEKHSDGFSTPRSTISSSKWSAPVVRAMSRPGTPRSISRVNFFIWRRSQPIGLQALLA
ncbi:hypothetical protein KC19_VG329800 [Ceratodon purpureus]|uniref:PIN domain-containing protein n=2 Tax=Ceratodon purpureus TaxID=3225 RepID=A0A8T0HX49_CERPU|nr:hypothetical protein KC19_VG329800 [Ceratodon purpureus]